MRKSRPTKDLQAKKEADVSRERAIAVHDELRRAVFQRSIPNDAIGLRDSINWRRYGNAAKKLKIPNPSNETQRSLNRRVYIYFARGAPQSRLASRIHCVHGGQIMRVANPNTFPTKFDRWVVFGCPNMLLHSREFQMDPCVDVVWTLTGENGVIEVTSQGHTVSKGPPKQDWRILIAF